MGGSIFPADRPDGRDVGIAQGGPGREPDLFLGDQQYVQRRFEQTLIPSEELPDPAPDPIAVNGVPDFLTGDGGHPGMAEAVGEIDQVEIFPSGATAFLIELMEFFLLADPLARTIAFKHQTARRFLPFWRRLLMTFWPPFVLMRTKNPWSFFLFLLLGLNVGFILV
jgi:hypothetical protein